VSVLTRTCSEEEENEEKEEEDEHALQVSCCRLKLELFLIFYELLF
jgi:hypothetical protein